MPCIITSASVDEAVRTVLTRRGFSVSASKLNGETGVDLLARRAEDIWHIETIAFKSGAPQRSADFRTGFFRAISRIRTGATQLALAMPADFGAGLHQRAAQYGEAWRRLGIAFPELEIWLVVCEEPSIARSSWNSWLE
jgi:hypothetical protein